jgi:hypothetical protein
LRSSVAVVAQGGRELVDAERGEAVIGGLPCLRSHELDRGESAGGRPEGHEGGDPVSGSVLLDRDADGHRQAEHGVGFDCADKRIDAVALERRGLAVGVRNQSGGENSPPPHPSRRDVVPPARRVMPQLPCHIFTVSRPGLAQQALFV